MIVRIDKSLYDVYKSPSIVKQNAYNIIIEELQKMDGNYTVFTSGNSFNFTVLAIDFTMPLAKLPNHEVFGGYKYTKTGKRKTTIKLY